MSIHLVSTARTLVNELQAPKNDFSKITGQYLTITRDMEMIRAGTAPLFPILRAAQGLSWVGLYLGQVEPLLDFGTALAQAGHCRRSNNCPA